MFTGERYVTALNGSFNGNDDLTDIPAGQFIEGSRNGNTHNGGFEKRGGTEKVGSAITNNPASLGGGQLIKRSTLTKHLYFAGADGNLYRNGTSIVAGRSQTAWNFFTPIDDTMFVANGFDLVKVDTGAAVATITGPAADWSGNVQPKKFILHSKQASRRAFAWGVPGKENVLYYSAAGAFQTFTGGTSGTIVLDFNHGEGIVDCVSKDGTLWVFGKEEVFVVDDSSTTVADWGAYRASFQTGVHSARLTCVAKNSIFAMNTEGDIYEVQTAEQVRDYKQASISYPFFLLSYMRRNWDLSQMDKFYMAYEPKTESLRIFGVRLGQTVSDESIPYYINQQKWSVPHDGIDNGQANDTGLKAATAFLAQDADEFKVLYTQDYNGQTWELESDTKTDNGNAYSSTASTPWLDFDLEGIEKRYPYASLSYKSLGDYDVDVEVFVDGVSQTVASIALTATGAVLGSFVLDTDMLALVGISEREFEIGLIGRKIRVEITNSGAGEDFLLSQLVFPFLNRGVRRR